MRLYHAFDFVLIITINVSFLFQIEVLHTTSGEVMQCNACKKNKFDKNFNFNVTSPEFHTEIFRHQILQNINIVMLSVKRCFIALITLDVANLLSNPFEFKRYQRIICVLRRIGVTVVFSLALHTVHLVEIWHCCMIVSYKRYGYTRFHWIRFSEGFKFSVKMAHEIGHNLVVTGFCCRNILLIKKSLKEMAPNDFGRNSHYDSLYKMTIALVVIVVSAIPMFIGRFVQIFLDAIVADYIFIIVKATYDMLISIIIIFIFYKCFPNLRPKLRNGADTAT